jgi:integrase
MTDQTAVSRSTALTPVKSEGIAPRDPHPLDLAANSELAAQIRDAEAYIRAAHAPNTQRSYKAGWKAYLSWCRMAGCLPEPEGPEQIVAFLTSLVPSGEGVPRSKISTVKSRLAAVRYHARKLGWKIDLGHPLIGAVIKGMGRTHSELKDASPVDALRFADLEVLVGPLEGSSSPVAVRDRALILIGYAGALRRSELVGLQVGDIRRARGGLVLRVSGKTESDSAAKERMIAKASGSSLCPVTALDAWLKLARLVEGPVFRGFKSNGGLRVTALHPESVRTILRQRAAEAGITKDGLHGPEPMRIAGHSLRRGMATEVAARTGGDVKKVMEAGGWSSTATALRYVDLAKSIEESASGVVFAPVKER